ncbi:MAG: DUF2083 domain-containing protein [Gammaproteobacteria bacterium]|nr:DUF2083 domain-containing protein [Gammaproteobacteria bacterium]
MAATGARIKERRKSLGLTQVELARRVGISAPYLNLIEADKRPLRDERLRALADALDTDVQTLGGTLDQRLLDDLAELRTDPLFQGLGHELEDGGELLGRFPGWTRALLGLYRNYLASTQTVAALSDRLNRDPLLADAVHQMLTHLTALRSSAEILVEATDLDAARLDRFHRLVSEESERLSAAARSLVDFFDDDSTPVRPLTAADEVDDFIISHRNYFDSLEQAADEMRRSLWPARLRGSPPRSGADQARDGSSEQTVEGALIEHLARAHGITVRRTRAEAVDLARFSNQCAFDVRTRELLILDSAPGSSRRFQLARLVAEHSWPQALDAELGDPQLGSDDARERARRALASYMAGAALFPYQPFLEHAERLRYDVEALQRIHGAGFEQIAHRLVTLGRPGAEGIPLGFMRADPSGFVSKRFPLPGFALPRYGQACPLWMVYAAFQTPGQVVAQVARFPNGSSYLFVARTVSSRRGSHHAPRFMRSVMLACDLLHADRTVYADGLNLGNPDVATPVGPSCRLCPRRDCLYRQEQAAGLGLA